MKIYRFFDVQFYVETQKNEVQAMKYHKIAYSTDSIDHDFCSNSRQ